MITKTHTQKILKEIQETYDKIAFHFSETRSTSWQDFNAFTPYLQPGQCILDCGCGNGRVLSWLHSEMHLPPNQFVYVGLDKSEALIHEAQRLHPEIPTVRFMQGDMLRLPFKDASFDRVFAIASLYHIPTSPLRQTAINEMARVLKPGGMMFMMNWNLAQRRFWKEHIAAWPKILLGQAEFGDLWIPWKTPDRRILGYRYGHAFTQREMRKLIRCGGLTLQRLLFTRQVEPSTIFSGFNLLTIAKKI